MNVISGFLRAVRTGLAAARDYTRLSGMSDAALRARGLTRRDIPDLVRRARFGGRAA